MALIRGVLGAELSSDSEDSEENIFEESRDLRNQVRLSTRLKEGGLNTLQGLAFKRVHPDKYLFNKDKILEKFNTGVKAVESFHRARTNKGDDNVREKEAKPSLPGTNPGGNEKFETPIREYWSEWDKGIWNRVFPKVLEQESKINPRQEPFNPTY